MTAVPQPLPLVPGVALAGMGGLLCAVGDNALAIPVVVLGPCLLALACHVGRASQVLLLGAVFGIAEAALAFSAVRYGAGAVVLALSLNSVKRGLSTLLVWGVVQLPTMTTSRASASTLVAGAVVWAVDWAAPLVLGTLHIPVSFAEAAPRSGVVAALASGASTEFASAAIAMAGGRSCPA